MGFYLCAPKWNFLLYLCDTLICRARDYGKCVFHLIFISFFSAITIVTIHQELSQFDVFPILYTGEMCLGYEFLSRTDPIADWAAIRSTTFVASRRAQFVLSNISFSEWFFFFKIFVFIYFYLLWVFLGWGRLEIVQTLTQNWSAQKTLPRLRTDKLK